MSKLAPSRRGLLAATAWSVPTVVVASAAPAFADSGPVCTTATYRVNWARSNFPTPVSSMMAVSTPVAAPAVAVSMSSDLNGMVAFYDSSDNTTNMTVSPYNVGGTSQRGLTLQQQLPSGVKSTTRARRQEVTFTFTSPVKGLSFRITDIDGTNKQYRDMVELSPAPDSVVHQGTTGAGTVASPLKSAQNANVDVQRGGGTALVRYPADEVVSSFTLTFWNGDTNGNLSARGQQAVFVTDMTFTASTC